MFIINLIFKIIFFVDKSLENILNISILRHISTFYQKNSNQYVKFKDNKIKFFCPTKETKVRVNSFFFKRTRNN